jgi:HD-GYP domain-containing protein (c-di-GMP phosphodiesterase class II)
VLLTSIDDIRPGQQIGASVMSRESPELVLLKPGVILTAQMITRLRRHNITQLWVDHPLTRDLDAAVAPALSRARLECFNRLKDDVVNLAGKTISTAQIRSYRNAVTDLVREALLNKDYVNLTAQIFDSAEALVSHSTNVAFLSVLAGLELEGYLVRERTRLPPWRARNVVNLGLGALLHDIGKTQQDAEVMRCHDVLTPDATNLPPAYFEHAALGYEMLPTTIPSAARNAVLCHHLRFDGSGWSSAEGSGGTTKAGHRIHVFSRIVAAANALDNLLHNADGTKRPPVAALHDFASARFDGWFDPVVRLAVLKRVPPFAVGTQVTLSDGREGVVTQPSTKDPCRPVVRVLETGSELRSPEDCTHVDLTGRRDLHIAASAGVGVGQWLFEISDRANTSAFRRDELPDVA